MQSCNLNGQQCKTRIEQYLQEDCIKAGPQLQHSIHFSLDLKQVSGGTPPLLGQFGNCLAGIMHVCALVHSLPDYPKAACTYHFPDGVPVRMMKVLSVQCMWLMTGCCVDTYVHKQKMGFGLPYHQKVL